MECPKCSAPMREVKKYDVTLDQCSNCKGFWFDQFELEDTLEMDGAETLDDGDTETGIMYNKVDRIKCPKCTTQMIRMAHRKQHHVWYESCTVCGGSFLDAGELKDLKEETWGDFFKSFFTKERE